MTAYEAILDNAVMLWTAGEARRCYSALSEKHLQVLWWEQRWLRPLTTVEGLSVEVIEPGQWNGGSGPDFINARLSINGVALVGDVEVHLHQEGWYSHNHHLDSRYDNVILHVSLWGADHPIEIKTSHSKKIHTLALDSFLQIELHRLEKHIDIDLYPHCTKKASGRCGQQLFSRIDKKDTLAFFASAALWRLKQKTLRFKLYGVNDEELVAIALAYCFGLPRQSGTFVALYQWLCQQTEIQDVDTLHALALAKTGLLDERYEQLWGNCEQWNRLRNLAMPHHIDKDKQMVIRREGGRATHHPVRRLFMLAALVADKRRYKWLTLLKDIWRLFVAKEEGQGRLKWLDQQLKGLLPSYSHPWWSTHHLFGSPQNDKPISLPGKALRNECILNGLLPILYSEALNQNSSVEWEFFLQYYKNIPAQKYAFSSYLSGRFLDEGNESITSHAIYEQGALQLHSDFCSHYGQSCRGCPLVDRYNRKSQNKDQRFDCSS